MKTNEKNKQKKRNMKKYSKKRCFFFKITFKISQ